MNFSINIKKGLIFSLILFSKNNKRQYKCRKKKIRLLYNSFFLLWENIHRLGWINLSKNFSFASVFPSFKTGHGTYLKFLILFWNEIYAVLCYSSFPFRINWEILSFFLFLKNAKFLFTSLLSLVWFSQWSCMLIS